MPFPDQRAGDPRDRRYPGRRGWRRTNPRNASKARPAKRREPTRTASSKARHAWCRRRTRRSAERAARRACHPRTTDVDLPARWNHVQAWPEQVAAHRRRQSWISYSSRSGHHRIRVRRGRGAGHRVATRPVYWRAGRGRSIRDRPRAIADVDVGIGHLSVQIRVSIGRFDRLDPALRVRLADLTRDPSFLRNPRPGGWRAARVHGGHGTSRRSGERAPAAHAPNTGAESPSTRDDCWARTRGTRSPDSYSTGVFGDRVRRRVFDQGPPRSRRDRWPSPWPDPTSLQIDNNHPPAGAM